MRRIWIAGIAAALLTPVLIAAGALRQEADPEKSLAEINTWQQEQIRIATENKQQVDFRKLSTERIEKAKAAVAGVNAETVAPEKGLAWAQLYQIAQMPREQVAAAARYVGTNPDADKKFQAHNLMLMGYNLTGQADRLLQLLGEVKPPTPQAAATLAQVTANVYTNTIAGKIGPEKALDILQRIEAQVPLSEFKTEREKLTADSVVVTTSMSRAGLLEKLGKKDEALAALEAGKAKLNPGSRMLRSLEGKIKQTRLPGSPAPELKAARTIGEFPGLQSWKGKVVVLDFFAHW